MDLFPYLDTLQDLQHSEGGFPHQTGESPRVDATSWATLALSLFPQYSAACDRGRVYLASQQTEDGRICISPHHHKASWPTPLAVLAWHHAPHVKSSQELAIDFLLNFTGEHWPVQPDTIMGHDTSIRGWPWIAHTHSWVIPTSMAIMALTLVGLNMHERVTEGSRMLLNRQLPRGGWNSGNTLVFGKELLPLPECTGIALQALAENAHEKDVGKSLDYLLGQLPHLRTPISLGWTLLGLGAWGLKPKNTEVLVRESLRLQDRHGPYSVPSIALLLCAQHAPQGLLSLFASSPNYTNV